MEGINVTQQGFASEAELEDALGTPSAGLIEDLAKGSGDLVILGAGGKMGPTLAMLARRGMDAAGRSADTVYAVSRFGDAEVRARLEAANVQVIAFDLIENDDFSSLPDAAEIVFMVGAKFGAATNASWAWEVNAALPDRVARRYRDVLAQAAMRQPLRLDLPAVPFAQCHSRAMFGEDRLPSRSTLEPAPRALCRTG